MYHLKLQVRGSKMLSGHADLYAVSRCRTRDESEDHTSKKACKEYTLTLKTGHISPELQNSGISGSTKRILPSKIYFKQESPPVGHCEAYHLRHNLSQCNLSVGRGYPVLTWLKERGGYFALSWLGRMYPIQSRPLEGEIPHP